MSSSPSINGAFGEESNSDYNSDSPIIPHSGSIHEHEDSHSHHVSCTQPDIDEFSLNPITTATATRSSLGSTIASSATTTTKIPSSKTFFWERNTMCVRADAGIVECVTNDKSIC